MRKLHRLSRVKVKIAAPAEADTVKYSRLLADDNRRALDVLLEAQTYYSNMYRFRKDRERNKRYYFGDQWGDIVEVNGCRMTEEQYIMKQGNVPLKNNLIRRLGRNVVGVYRQQATEPTCTARDRDEQRATASRDHEHRAAIQHAAQPHDRDVCTLDGGVSHQWTDSAPQVVRMARQ